MASRPVPIRSPPAGQRASEPGADPSPSLPSMLTNIMQAGSPAEASFMPQTSAPSLDEDFAPAPEAPATAGSTFQRPAGLPPAGPPRSMPTHPPPPPGATAPLNIDTSAAPSDASAVLDAPLSPKTLKLLRRIRRREEELEALGLENALLKEANRRANEERVVREQEKRVEARRRAEEDAAWKARVAELEARVKELTPQDDAEGVHHDPIECSRTINDLRELLQLREEQLELINLDRFKLYEEIETWKAGMEKLASLHGAYSPSSLSQSPRAEQQQQQSLQPEHVDDDAEEKRDGSEQPVSSKPVSPLPPADKVQPPSKATAAVSESAPRRGSALLASFLPAPIAALLTSSSSSSNSTANGSAPTTPSASSAAAASPQLAASSSPTSPRSYEPVLEEVWQNEHRHPLLNWQATRSAFLRYPFSDESGSKPREFDKIALPPGWVWDGAWQLDRGEWDAPDERARVARGTSTQDGGSVSSGTDPAGWRYSIALRLFAWHAEPGRLDTVRRRRWLRRRVYVGTEATEAMLENAFRAIAAAHALPDGVARAAALVAAGVPELEANGDAAAAAKHDPASLAALAAAYSSSDPSDSFSMFTSVAPPEVGGGASTGEVNSGARALAALLQLGGASKPASPAPATNGQSAATAQPSESSASAASSGAPSASGKGAPASSTAPTSLTSAVASYIATPAVNLGAYLASTRLSSWVAGRGSGTRRTDSADAVSDGNPVASLNTAEADGGLDTPERSVSPMAPSSAPSRVCSYCSCPSRTALQFVSPQTGFVMPLTSYCQRHYPQAMRHIAEGFHQAGPLSEHEHHMRDKARSTLPPTMCAYCESTDTYPVKLLHLGAPLPDSPLPTDNPAASSSVVSSVCEVLDSHDIQRFCEQHMPSFLKLVSQFQPRMESPPVEETAEDEDGAGLDAAETLSDAAAASAAPRARVLILGANGLIGRHCYHALRGQFELTLVDRAVGKDERNRFAAEGVTAPSGDGAAAAEQSSSAAELDLSIPDADVVRLDLLSQASEFEGLVSRVQPRVVLHLANALETAPLEVIEANRRVDELVMRTCVAHDCACIAASSIRVYYAAVMRSPLLSRVFRGDASAVIPPADRLDSRSALRNDEESIALYTPPEKLAQALAYAQGKLALEELVLTLASSPPSSSAPAAAGDQQQQQRREPTLIAVRWGWASVRPPEELEAEARAAAGSSEDSPSISQLSVVLRAVDLRSFVSRLVTAVVDRRIVGFRLFTAVSEHPQRWVSLQNEEKELGWRPLPLALVEAQAKSV